MPANSETAGPCALARGAVRPARRLGSSRFIGEAPMKTAEAAVLPGTGGTAGHARGEIRHDPPPLAEALVSINPRTTDATAQTNTQAMPAARAASAPLLVSSSTRQCSGGTPRRVAAVRKGSGAGLPRT